MRAVIIGAAKTLSLPPVALIGPVVLVNFVQHELSRVSIDVTPVASVGVSAAAAASVGVDVVPVASVGIGVVPAPYSRV